MLDLNSKRRFYNCSENVVPPHNYNLKPWKQHKNFISKKSRFYLHARFAPGLGDNDHRVSVLPQVCKKITFYLCFEF